VDDGEVRASLRYGATLGLAFGVGQGGSADGSVAIDATGPDESFVVSAEDDRVRVHAGPAGPDARVLQGDAVTLLEQLSLRDTGVPVPAAVTWMTEGLVEVFDQGQ
jgi:hypothetical protein